MAAKLKLTDEARKQILSLCRAGLHPERAFVAAGLAASSLRRYRMYAKQGKRDAIKFLDQLEMAVAQCEGSDVLASRRATVPDSIDTMCPQCGEQVKLDTFAVLALGRQVTAAQNVKASAAAIALQRLKLRFPRRWSERVVHTVEDEHQRLLDVAERVLAPEVFESLLEAYVAETSGDEPPEPDPVEPGPGELH